jgi:hypothetical protein
MDILDMFVDVVVFVVDTQSTVSGWYPWNFCRFFVLSQCSRIGVIVGETSMDHTLMHYALYIIYVW